jgi:solute:Na+ symporter, SSS family
MPDKIGPLDLAMIAAYLLGIVAVGCYAGLKRRQEGEANRYFLAAHSLRWPSIGMALFATNMTDAKGGPSIYEFQLLAPASKVSK